MTCPHCYARVENALNSLNGVQARVNVAAKSAVVQCSDYQTPNGRSDHDTCGKTVHDFLKERIDGFFYSVNGGGTENGA